MIRHPEQPIFTDIAMTEGLFVRSHLIPRAGSRVPQHIHKTDHVTVIAAGAVEVWVNDEQAEALTAPQSRVIRAGQKHLFVTLYDNTVLLCVHRVGPDGLPEITAEHQIVEGEG
jgi:quercetin dioxygenase-like cupin family protein